MSKVVFRVYRPATQNRPEKDSIGSYDGWNTSYDEYISILSPRIAPFGSRVGKQETKPFNHLQDYSFKTYRSKNFELAMPQSSVCLSKKYLDHMYII